MSGAVTKPTFVVEPQALPMLPREAPPPQLPAVVGKTETRELQALAAARAAHASFDEVAKVVGKGSRLSTRRFSDRLASVLVVPVTVGIAASGVLSLATAILGTMRGMPWLEAMGAQAGAATAAVFVGAIFCGIALDALHEREVAKTGPRPLKRAAIEPLRLAHAQAPTGLQRAVLAELAKVYLQDLDDRQVVGEAPRIVLREIAASASLEDKQTQAAAKALVKLFDMTHDVFGKLRARLAGDEALEIEYLLAALAEPTRGELRAMLLPTLFDGDVARLRLGRVAEGRLYRVLTGADAPSGRAKPATQATPAELAQGASALTRDLFAQDKLAKPIGAKEAQEILGLLQGLRQLKRPAGDAASPS